MYELSTLIPGIVVGCVAIAVAHLALWDLQLPRVPAYVIGTTCVLAGMVVSTAITGDWRPVGFYLAHLIPAGAIIALAWGARGALARRAVAEADARAIQEAAERERTG